MLRALLCVASFASIMLAQSGEQAVAVRSLQPFLPPTLQTANTIVTALASNEGSWQRNATARTGANNDTDAGWLIALLNARHSKSIDAEELVLTVDANTRLAMRGNKGAVNSCLADLDAIASTLARSIEITAYRLPVPAGDLPPAFMSGATLQASIAAEAPLWSARAVTRPGGSVQIGDVQWTSYMRDQDVEVAKKADIADPKVDSLFQGTRMALTVHALPNDELLLHGSWLTSERISLEEFSTGKDQPSIDAPHNKTAYVTFAGRVQNGDGLLVAGKVIEDGGMSFVFAVRARYLTPPPGRADRLFVFPASAWSHATSTAWPLRPVRFVGEDDRGQHPIVDKTPVLGPEKLAAFVGSGGDGAVSMEGHVLVIDGSSAACAKAEARLKQLANAQLHGAELRIQAASSPTAAAAKFVQPVLANMQARAFVGRERALVADYEVEIAENSDASNPIVRNAYEGVWSRVTTHPMGRDWNVMGMWRTARQLPPRLRVQTAKESRLLQLPDYKTSTWPWDGPLQANKAMALSPHFSVELRTQ